MFSRKYKIPTVCDSYLNIYDKCNVGCSFCKFNQNVDNVKLNNIDFDKYNNEKILVCYSVDPYPVNYDKSIVPNVISRLHNNNCNIVFLTRRANCLISDISIFNESDYIGVSISENCVENSSIEDIKQLLSLAKERHIKTWISLEPIETFDYAKEIIDTFINTVDFIRVGKNDLDYNAENWQDIKTKVNQLNIKNVFVKD